MGCRSAGDPGPGVGALLDLGAVAGLTDGQLVERFVAGRGDPTGRAEAAFAALVARHGGMVLGVARRVLRDDSAAEDAFQATFLVLARRAGAVRVGDSLGPWLHGVARRVAARLRAQAARRATVGLVPGAVGFVSPDAAEMAELGEVLDREIGRLPGRLRESVVLCLLEGQSLGEAAGRMGCAVGTAGSRLSRARDLLRARLRRRGFVPHLVLLEPTHLAAPVPPPLVRSATLFAVGEPLAAIPAPIATLARATLREMTMTRTLGLTLLAAGTLAIVGTIAGTVRSAPTAAPAPPPAPAPARLDDPPATPARTMRVVVLGPDGRPVAGAKVHASIWTDAKDFERSRDYAADASGGVSVETPATYTTFRLRASGVETVTLIASWEEEELAKGTRVPAEYTFRLERPTTAGGRVVDEAGRPIAGARLRVSLADLRSVGGPQPVGGDGRVRYNTWLAGEDDEIATDADGRWQIRNVPAVPDADLLLFVSHPDFVSDRRWGGAQEQSGVTSAQMRQGTAVVTLRRGVAVTGSVTDPTGRPVREGLIVTGDRLRFAQHQNTFPIGPDGRYRLAPLATEVETLTAIVPGFAPELRRVDLKPGLPPQDFRLGPGRPIRLRVVDPAGRPIADAEVRIAECLGHQSIDNHDDDFNRKTKIPRRTDEAGAWEWAGAPASSVRFEIGRRDRSDSIEATVEIAGGSPERTIKLRGEHRITGRVVDGATGVPIPAFTVIPVDVFRPDWLGAERNNGQPGRDGRLDYLPFRADIPLRVRIEAPGYRTATGPEFRVGDDSPRTQDFRLTPAPPIVGTVLDAEGKPAPKAEIFLATPTEWAEMEKQRNRSATATTDDAGRFALPDPGEPWVVVARTAAGTARAGRPAGSTDAGVLRLQPWASVRGRFVDGGRPVVGALVLLQPVQVMDVIRPRVEETQQATTDAEGRFAFAKVPPGAWSARVYLGPWKDEGYRSGPSVPLLLRPDQRADVDLGGAGATVAGQVDLAGAVPPGLDCTFSLNHLVRRAAGIEAPAVAGLGFDARQGWSDTWTKSPEGMAYQQTIPHWFVKLAPDGSFRVSGVPSGEYDLAVAVYAKPDGCLVDPLARSVVRLTVTEAEATAGASVAVPSIAAEVRPVPTVGETPALSFERPDGSTGSLLDHRGRYLLVDFWASWCAPCRQQVPALRRLRDEQAPRGLAVLGLSLDEDASAWRAAVREHGLPWPQGRLAAGGAAGVSVVPAYWLLDPDGKIVAKANDPAELAARLAEIGPAAPKKP